MLHMQTHHFEHEEMFTKEVMVWMIWMVIASNVFLLVQVVQEESYQLACRKHKLMASIGL